MENEIHKLIWDFEVKTDHLISTRRPHLIIINRKRELVKLWTFLSGLTTEKTLKKMKRKTNMSTLLRN